MIVPELPEQFLVEFVPRYFAELTARKAPASDAGGGQSDGGGRRSGRSPAPVGVLVRVVGSGEWTLRLVADRLEVTPGVALDVALAISLLARDFAPLVVEPVRRALAAAASEGGVAKTSAAAANGIWARLGRWDEETVDLLRRQTGRILVRVDDLGTSRNVALTPGAQAFSLEEAECSIQCELADLYELQAKRKNPLDLFYEGQIRITGDAQIALAMAGLFL